MLSTCLYTFWVRPRNLDLLCPGPCAVYCFIVRNSAIILDLSYCALTLYCRVAPEVLMTSDVAPGGSVLLRNVSWSWIPWTAAYPVLHLPGAEILTVPVRRTKNTKRNKLQGKEATNARSGLPPDPQGPIGCRNKAE